MTVLALVGHIRTLGKENISEGRMAAVAGTGKHHKIAVDLSGKQNWMGFLPMTGFSL